LITRIAQKLGCSIAGAPLPALVSACAPRPTDTSLATLFPLNMPSLDHQLMELVESVPITVAEHVT
jgi:hypothetical protein